MNRLTKIIVLTTAVAATTISTIPAANAGERWHHHHHESESRGGGLSGGDIATIGVLGLAAGVLASSVVTSNSAPSGRVYIDPPVEPGYYPAPPAPRYERSYQPHYAQPPRPRYVNSTLEPWTREWFDYCSDRYRSFNPRTGTYNGYDGRTHFCTAG
ncbi:BA14K family protein [Rhizobium sp. L1K21]|uniref:BA14K family protein n=1 Tax=Rhizobium sp. L1K21 TaxID=2954933 RepID=UPI002093FDA0|nr:BA14K family protein [Rhizobium sp. L1K21]MCO6185485.1 BA14K family protein [Rhizobium sp. L1K21]